MENNLVLFPSMAFVKSKDNLCKNAPNEVFLDKSLRRVRLSALLDHLGEITTFANFHNQVNRGILFVYKLIITSYNILVLQLAQDVHFIDELLLLLFAFPSIISLLPNHLSIRRDMCHLRNLPVRTF